MSHKPSPISYDVCLLTTFHVTTILFCDYRATRVPCATCFPVHSTSTMPSRVSRGRFPDLAWRRPRSDGEDVALFPVAGQCMCRCSRNNGRAAVRATSNCSSWARTFGAAVVTMDRYEMRRGSAVGRTLGHDMHYGPSVGRGKGRRRAV